MNPYECVTHSHTMHYRSRAFTERYASAPKYTPHSESSRGKLLGLSPYGSLSLLNLPHTSFHFSSLFYSFPFHTLFTIFFSSYNHDASEYHKLQNSSIISTIPIIPTFSITQQNKIFTLKFPKIHQQIFKNSHINIHEFISQFPIFSIILIIPNIWK